MNDIIISSVAAAVLTYGLNVHRGYSPVMASAAVSLFFGTSSFILESVGFLDTQLSKSVPAAAMGASFAGMSSKEAIPNYAWIAVSGAIFSLIFLSSSPLFAGLGGGLGITACVSVVMTRGIIKFFRMSNSKTPKSPPQRFL